MITRSTLTGMHAPRDNRARGNGARRHASAEEYTAFLQARVRTRQIGGGYAQQCAERYGRFTRAYPDLEDWFAAPLVERIGRPRGGTQSQRYPLSWQARPYLSFLALRGHAWFDRAWLAAMPSLYLWCVLVGTPLGALIDALQAEAVQLGYARDVATRGLRWTVVRLYMHTLDDSLESIDTGSIDAFEGTMRSFAGHPDRDLLFGSAASYHDVASRCVANLQLLRAVLYHRGQLTAEPRRSDYRGTRPVERPALKPRMEAVVQHYLVAKHTQCRPATVERFDLALGHFVAWSAAIHPEVDSFAAVTRAHVLEYAEALNGMTGQNTGRPLSTRTKEGYLSGLSVFFAETAAWGWGEVPGRPLLGRGELPRRPRRIPRYIPDEELIRLMGGIRSLECPYQRAALLIARWSGARRDEIRRLEANCLDTYPDGTPRLRIPAGKTYEERLVPLNEEAAEAIRRVQAQRRGEPVRGFRDELTGTLTHRLFVHHGKIFSVRYLFEAPLGDVCRRVGLVTPDGKPTVTAHRFRHTVGTQLAERGARLHTIMKVLGHQSVGMAVVYAQISDREVLKDYQAVLGPGATIAGPLAATLRAGALPATDVDWLKHNFFKTELELGHCLRLPREGPCECDLYLSCAKFVTTTDYAPRLRERRRREFALIEEAISNGWEKEVERHRCTTKRIEQLLTELGEPMAMDVREEKG